VTQAEVFELLELEGAKLETIAVHGESVVFDFRFRGTDDGARRITFHWPTAYLAHWNSDVGDFRGSVYDQDLGGPTSDAAIERLMFKIADRNDASRVCIICGVDAPSHADDCEFVAVTIEDERGTDT
jgi:hypothetical protein